MNIAVKFDPVNRGVCLDVLPTIDQLKQEARDFVATLVAANINPVGLRPDDFVWVVLRRLMDSLTAEARNRGIKFFAAPCMGAGCDITDRGLIPVGDEGPFIIFFCATEADAVALRLLVP